MRNLTQQAQPRKGAGLPRQEAKMRTEIRDGKIIIALRNDAILKPFVKRIIGKKEFGPFITEDIPALYEDNKYKYFEVREGIVYMYHEPFTNKENRPFKVINGKIHTIEWKEAEKGGEINE